MGDDIIYVKKLFKTFKGEKALALNDIEFILKKKQMAALIGPDGAGKTTFLRILCGLLRPDNIKSSTAGRKAGMDDGRVQGSGEVLINGISPFDSGESLAKVKKIIGYMPQKFGLYEDLTVIENLNLFVSLNTLNGSREKLRDKTQDDKELINTLLEFAGLIDFKTRLTGNLSGGMKQKLGLCCTLITKPELLLLDEPSVGVDPVSRLELMEIVKKLVFENGISVIWSTSYLDEAENFEQVFLLSEGRKIYDGTPKIQTGEAFEDFVINKIKENRTNALKEAAIEQITKGFSDVIPENTVTIYAEGLTKIYGKGKKQFVAANNVNLSIKKGEIFGLLGPNGAGKSTTFKMLCGLISATKGYSSIMGVRMDENPSLARSYLGYMAQKFSLFGDLSVVQNLNFFAGVYGLSLMDGKRRIAALLEVFDLKKYKNYDAKNLPLGYKQRLALSCAIVHNPPVLFLDEPTSGVDPLSRREFWNQINFLSKNGTTVLITTHFMDEAQFCNRISMIFKGKTLVTDTPDNLKKLAASEKNPKPTMQDAFIELILRERENAKQFQGGEISDAGGAK